MLLLLLLSFSRGIVSLLSLLSFEFKGTIALNAEVLIAEALIAPAYVSTSAIPVLEVVDEESVVKVPLKIVSVVLVVAAAAASAIVGLPLLILVLTAAVSLC